MEAVGGREREGGREGEGGSVSVGTLYSGVSLVWTPLGLTSVLISEVS